MKMIFRISCIILLAYSNLASQSNYFPSKIGNYWIYEKNSMYAYDYSYFILDTMSINNKLYYLRLVAFEYDSVTKDNNGYVSNIQNNEMLNSYWLNAKEGDSWYLSPNSSHRIILLSTSDPVSTKVDYFLNCKKYYFGNTNCCYWLAPDVGLVKYCDYSLFRTKINGKYVGSFTKITKNENRMEDYFPLKIGNFWIYQKANTNMLYAKYVFDSINVEGKIFYKICSGVVDLFRLDGNDIIFKMSNVALQTDSESVYYRFNNNIGDVWHSKEKYGHFNYDITLLRKNDTIRTKAGVFSNCYLFQLDDPKWVDEDERHWFAPNVGLVYISTAWEKHSLLEAQIDGKKYSQKTGIDNIIQNNSIFSLSQNYPNPFNPTTVISYSLPANCFVTLKIYDVLGKEVETLVNKPQQAGNYSCSWNPNSVIGRLPSGIYFYKLVVIGSNPLQTEKFTEVKKMVFIK